MTSTPMTPARLTSGRMASKHWQRGRLAAVVVIGYLALVVGTFVFAFVSTLVEHDDASLAFVIPLLATSPLSTIGTLALLSSDGNVASAVIVAGVAVCGGLQALGLWLALRGRRLLPGDCPPE
jgi:hypothetical protein